MSTAKSNQRFIIIFSLVIAGEAIFFLPFVMTRIFRPTMLDFFGIDNTSLGYFFSIYGIIAMVSYLFGGVLADRFQARKLMAVALFLTAVAGFVLAIFPQRNWLGFIYGFWGFTSIFLFWAAMIRATREWGGSDYQGRAFGWLEGGRGATAALLGSVSYIIFSILSIENTPESGSAGPLHPFQYVILSTASFTFLAGLLVWFFVPDSTGMGMEGRQQLKSKEIYNLVKKPGVWLLSVMIVCAYVGYKVTDDFSLYAREVLGFSESGSAGLGTLALWLRAIVAIIAGLTGDRFSKRGLISWLFLISAISGLGIAMGLWSDKVLLILLNFVFIAIGIYGVRALYFAVLREANIELAITGSAVGLISFIGYTPDIFMGPLMGVLLDNNPGETGHQLVFAVMTVFAFVGWIASLLFRKLKHPDEIISTQA